METHFNHFGRCMREKSVSLKCSVAPAVSVGSVQVSVCSLPTLPALPPMTAWTMASQDFPCPSQHRVMSCDKAELISQAACI